MNPNEEILATCDRFKIDPAIFVDWHLVLVIGHASSGATVSGRAAMTELSGKLRKILVRIMSKHLSDSPSIDEKKAFMVELFETAIKIVRREIVP